MTLAVWDGKEVRKCTEAFRDNLLNGALLQRQVVFPVEDLEIEDLFATHTYSLHGGWVAYTKGYEHIIDAGRYAILERE